jgi:hypothetical protein
LLSLVASVASASASDSDESAYLAAASLVGMLGCGRRLFTIVVFICRGVERGVGVPRCLGFGVLGAASVAIGLGLLPVLTVVSVVRLFVSGSVLGSVLVELRSDW